MRFSRLGVVFGILLAPCVLSAQEKNPFTDSWFWGAKGGWTVFHTSVARTSAPVIGADWLITRSWYGLSVGLDQAYFNAVSTVDDAPTRGISRRVDIRDMRRATVGMTLFPHIVSEPMRETLRPYVGFGYSFNFVVRAASEGDQYASPAARDTVLSRINNAKSRNSMTGTIGLQYHYQRYAPFIQATVMPTQGSGKFFLNGTGFTYYIEGGLRYNFGTSIDKTM